MQILDDGRLTDGKGRVVNFKNTIIIMTSNLGSHEILESKDYDEANKKVRELLKQYFRPEFLNRVDDIVVFKALQKDQVRNIAAILLERLGKRLENRSRSTSPGPTKPCRNWPTKASTRSSVPVRCAA